LVAGGLQVGLGSSLWLAGAAAFGPEVELRAVVGLDCWFEWSPPTAGGGRRTTSVPDVMTAPSWLPTLLSMSTETPTFDSLERARTRQHATLRLFRPLAVLVIVLVAIAGARTQPRPGFSGEHLGVLLALIGFAAAVAGAIASRRAPAAIQVPILVPLFALLLASSAVLVWLQPDGLGLVGVFIAVSAAGLRLPSRAGTALVVGALVASAVAATQAEHHSVTAAVLNELGVAAFYLMARFAGRVQQGQEQAERLLKELEQTRQAQVQAAALAERQRLAREMHDVLAHSLSGLVLQLEGARLLAVRQDGDPQVADAVERAHQLARAGLGEARRAIGMLRDDDLPGPERLPSLVCDFERDAGVPASLEVVGRQRELGSQARLTLYRTAQEALSNVRKHARPQRVELRLAYEPAGTRLTVEDFGGNRPAPLSDSGGYGLTGMRERAELLGGQLRAGPTGTGFRVELWVPA
jgi:signal transduction histidine kinase